MWNPWSNLLAIQVDAAINSGNSGGPVLNKDNKIVGIAMMKLNNTDNISYIVPSVVINTFFNDIKDGKVDGFPQTRTRVQHIENQDMKDYLGLKDDYGVLITKVDVEDVELKENDVLVSINGKKISNDGKIILNTPEPSFKFLSAFTDMPMFVPGNKSEPSFSSHNLHFDILVFAFAGSFGFSITFVI